MREPASQEVWKAVLGELQLQLPRPTYETWLKQTEGVCYEDQSLVVEVPTPFAVAWLERRMYQSIQKTLEKITHQPLDVRFQVKNGAAGEAVDPPSPDLHVESPAKDVPNQAPNGHLPRLPRLNPKYTFGSFVVGPSNRLACSAAQAVCDSPGRGYNPLFIYSGVGLGKTHLLHAIGQACASQGMSVLYATSEQFTNEFISAIRNRTTEEFRSRYRSVQVLLMDDVHFLSGKEQTHEGFFHTFNDLYTSGNQVVITCDRPPRALNLLEDRLRSRFEWGLITDIQPPDLETRMAILLSKADQLGVALSENVLELIAKRVQKNVRELEGSLNRVVAFSQLMNWPINLENTSRILDDLNLDTARHSIDPEQIIQAVSQKFRLSPGDLLGRSRTKKIAQARQVAMYLLIYELELSPTQVGRLLGGRDHATVIHGAGKINGEINEDGQLRQDVLAIKEAIFTPSASAAVGVPGG